MIDVNQSAKQGDVEAIRNYLDRGGDINAQCASDLLRSPLLAAIDAGQVGLVKYLLERGASVSVRDYRGYTALHRAAGMGMLSAVEALLMRHAEPNVLNMFGGSPLHAIANGGGRAADLDKARICQLLIGAGCEVDAKDSSGRTPLWFAVSSGSLAVAQALISAGADPTISADGTQGSPMDVGTIRGDPSLLQILTAR